MLAWLLTAAAEYASPLQVFQYLTLRTIFGAVTAFVIALLMGPWLIRLFGRYHIRQAIRDDGPRSHLSKIGTPTMGGLLLLPAIICSTLLWAQIDSVYIQVVLGLMLGFGLIGMSDDYLKLLRGSSKGLSVRQKLFWQLLVGGIGVTVLYAIADTPQQTELMVPFVKSLTPNLGLLYIPFALLVIIGSSNAVNLTDGLDGLAVMPSVLIGGALGLVAYLAGNVNFAEYLYIPYIEGAGELAVFCAALGGAGLGFLWFNTYPAQIFMGDIGALSLGAALGAVAVIARHELVLFIMGGIFVLEASSVIIQVVSYRLTGRRVFRMAPIHHHFELKGWPEPRVIVRFWIITVLLVLFGLSTLKLR